MPRNTQGVDIRMRLLGWKQLVQGANQGGAALTRMGRKGERAGKDLGRFGASAHGAHKRVHALIGGLAGLGVGFAAFEGLKESIDVTERLAVTTMRLSRNLGMSTQAAGQWAAVAHVRGIQDRSLMMGFTTLSSAVVAAQDPTSKQAQIFEEMGVGAGTLSKSLHGDLNPLIFELADGFGKMHGGAVRADAARKLFGRGYQSIIPLFKQGSESLRENLQDAQDMGAVLGIHTTADLQKFIVAQHKAEYATLGLQVAIGTYLAPVLTNILKAWPKLVKNVRDGNGAWGDVKWLVTTAADAFKTATGIIDHNTWAAHGLVVALGVLGGLMIASKVIAWGRALWGVVLVVRAATLATWAFNGAQLLALRRMAATGLVTAAITNWGLVGAAITRALGPLLIFVGAYEAYKSLVGPLTGPGLSAGKGEATKKGGHGTLRQDLIRKHGNPNHVGKYHGAAIGGIVTAGGGVVIGERGPELLDLPRAARVTPLPKRTGPGPVIHLVNQVVLDGRVAGQSVSTHQLLDAARA